MEQRIISQHFVPTELGIHKNYKANKNNTNYNRTRIKLFGKGYTIDNKRLELYKTIGDIIAAMSIVAGVYIMYCIMWLYQ